MPTSSEYVTEWTKREGDIYRSIYQQLSFEDKQVQMDAILQRYYQPADPPTYLLNCLQQLPTDKPLRIVELGGYNGQQAYGVLCEHPEATWVNYDISKIAEQLTLPELENYDYTCVLLEKPFHHMVLPKKIDVFYSSRMLEHLRFNEVCKVLDATAHARTQIHLVDWWWTDDTHVIEANCHNAIINYLHSKHRYRLVGDIVGDHDSKLFMAKPNVLRK